MKYVVAVAIAVAIVAVVLIAIRAVAPGGTAVPPGGPAQPAAPAGTPAEAGLRAAEQFLAANAKAEDVQVTPSGLQYKVLSPGAGEGPRSEDEVIVNYRGMHLDGTEFDSSVARGRPAQFRVGGVIKGWQEGLLLMKPGARYMFWVPSALGYGQSGRPPRIGPNELLVFEVELLSVVKGGGPAR